jgi:transglutaminase-like putative cysteine protease
MPVFYIHHRTHYHYPHWVVDSANQIKLYPLDDDRQRVLEHRLVISHHPTVYVIKDYFGNKTGFFSIIQPHRELSIESFLRVEMINKPLPQRSDAAEVWKLFLNQDFQVKWHDYLNADTTRSQSEVESIVSLHQDKHPLDELLRLSDFIYENFEYKKGVTTIETNIDELWKLKAGVCQDFAHLLLYMMRLRGVPCRYVSGYICPGDSEWRGEGATHAWAEAWLPDLGWVGIDPTNKCLAGERHVRLAVGRNFSDCTPAKGTYKGSLEHLLEVTVQFSSSTFLADQLLPKEVSPEQQMRFKQGALESYELFMQRQQQQQ